VTLATSWRPAEDVLGEYATLRDALGGAPDYRRQLMAEAEQFSADHPDPGEWMAGPLDARLVELARRPGAWPFVCFLLVSGRCRGDLDFLVAKNFGHSAGRTVAALHADDVARLREAAKRVGCSDEAFKELLGGMLPLVIAAAGTAPGRLDPHQLDELATFVEASPHLTPAMRRSRRSQLFRLRQLLFQAGMLDDPPPHQRQGGPATRNQRLAAVPAPEIRRTIHAYLDMRATVLRPKTVDKLTSALAIFGEFLGERFPDLTSLHDLDRHHVEAWPVPVVGARSRS